MTDYERSVIGPALTDLRSGVRPFDTEGIGVCEGKGRCDRFVGTSGTELPAGDGYKSHPDGDKVYEGTQSLPEA